MTAMVMTLAPELRLPWESSAEEDRRFRKILLSAFAAFVILCVAVPLLPVQDLTREEKEAVPPHLARVILEKKELPKPPPVPVKPKPKPKPVEKKAEKPKPVEKPNSNSNRQMTRMKTNSSKTKSRDCCASPNTSSKATTAST